jgi:hypothetical protein
VVEVGVSRLSRAHPCRSSQYLGLVVREQTSVWICAGPSAEPLMGLETGQQRS